jgi:hypothetical protein
MFIWLRRVGTLLGPLLTHEYPCICITVLIFLVTYTPHNW